MAIPFTRFLQISRVAIEKRAEDEKLKMQGFAFVGWQNYLMQPVDEKTERLSFQKWLEMLGLAEEKAAEAEETPAVDGLDIAEQIVQMDKKRRGL